MRAPGQNGGSGTRNRDEGESQRYFEPKVDIGSNYLVEAINQSIEVEERKGRNIGYQNDQDSGGGDYYDNRASANLMDQMLEGDEPTNSPDTSQYQQLSKMLPSRTILNSKRNVPADSQEDDYGLVSRRRDEQQVDDMLLREDEGTRQQQTKTLKNMNRESDALNSGLDIRQRQMFNQLADQVNNQAPSDLSGDPNNISRFTDAIQRKKSMD